jgi:hypothetical protein
MADMGLGKLGGNLLCLKRKFRWLLRIPDISGDSYNVLPPEKSARPSLSFKEIEAQHLNETIYFAGKPEWKPINLVLYDFKINNSNPIFRWLKEKYDPCEGTWKIQEMFQWKKTVASLEMYDGCGRIIEKWIYENVWPNAIEWGELDMSNSEYVTVDLTLRYDRAYIEEEC